MGACEPACRGYINKCVCLPVSPVSVNFAKVSLSGKECFTRTPPVERVYGPVKHSACAPHPTTNFKFLYGEKDTLPSNSRMIVLRKHHWWGELLHQKQCYRSGLNSYLTRRRNYYDKQHFHVCRSLVSTNGRINKSGRLFLCIASNSCNSLGLQCTLMWVAAVVQTHFN